MSVHSLKIYRMILLIVLLGILIPTLALLPFIRPLADDIAQPVTVVKTWRETGSITQTVKAAIDATINIYLERNGTFFAMFLSVVPFSIFHDRLLALNGLLSIVLLLAGMYRLAYCLQYVCRDVSQETVHCLALLLSILTFLLMPNYFESIYWFSAACGYVYVFALSIFLFSAVLKALLKGSLPAWKFVALCAGFFCLGGGNWINSTSSIVSFAGIALLALLVRKNTKILVIGLFLLLGYMIAVLCPGNSYRMTVLGEKRGLFSALVCSFLSAGKYLFSDARIWLLSVFMLPILVDAARRSVLSFRYPLLLAACSVCILAAGYFPMIYTNYDIMPRHINTIHMILVVLLPVNLFYTAGWLLRKCPMRIPAWLKSRRIMALVCVLVLLMTGVFSFDAPKISACTLEPAQALIHWIDGHSRYYADYYDSVVQAILDNPDGDITINWIVNDRMVNPTVYIYEDPEFWVNSSFAHYYGNEGCTIRYTP